MSCTTISTDRPSLAYRSSSVATPVINPVTGKRSFERREPGRIEHSPATLITVFRHPTTLFAPDLDEENLGPAKGIMVGVFTSAFVWIPLFWALI
jgi:hypothetical protein